MKVTMHILIALIIALSAMQARSAPMATKPVAGKPGVGEMAPAFDLPASDGKHYSLNQFRGDKPVVIAFFPRVFTGG